MKTGIQLSSFKPVLRTEEQVKNAFEYMKTMGCAWVQLQWITPSVSIEFIAECLKETEIQSVSVQDFYETIRQNKDYYIQLNEKTGGTWMCVSRIPERLKSKSGLKEYARELESLEHELECFGQKLCIHPVSADFVPVEDIVPMEYLLEQLPKLSICADLYHLNRCHYDMVKWLRHYAGRVCMAHFKDCKETNAGEKLVPAGQGDTDWTGVVRACAEIGVSYGFVEQETWERDPFDCLEEALDWLDREVAAL